MTDVVDVDKLARRLEGALARLGISAEPGDVCVLLDEVEVVIDKTLRDLALLRGERTALVEAVRMLSEGVVVCDRDGRVIYKNQLTLTWLESRNTNSVAAASLADVLITAASGRQNARSIEVLGPPRRSLRVNGIPILDADGNPAGAVAVLEEATDQRHVDVVARDFVANVSHELKTPIGALGLLAETLLVEQDPQVTARLVQRMHVETLRVGQVIDDLLSLSRIESARSVSAECVSAKELIDQAISRVRYAAEYRSVSIAVEGDCDATIYGGHHELMSAVHHLLENALKYSNENSTVEVQIKADGAWTEISVRDHGMGIAAPYLDRIFERFYRVDDARTRTTGGTGIGLSIVRHVVQNHGGEVRVASQEGKGSTFTLRLGAKPSSTTERLVVEGGTDG